MNGAADTPDRPAAPRGPGAGFGTLVGGWRGGGLAALFLLGLTALALGTTLFSRDLVLSNEGGDLALQFVHWRKFGFDELRAGRLALWNPHIYCGTPFFGGFQSALLYPPNWLYLCLPLVVAINVGIALHVFLAGAGMSLWMRERGLHPLAALFAGVVFMFSGPFFPHVYAGHLSNLCTMVWGPFIFLAIDGWLRSRTPGWLLLGAAGLTMQILAGHPQYVFYTGVAAALYCAVQLPVTRGRLQAAAGLAAFVLAGVALSAAQLFEGFHAAGEGVRNHGTDATFAAKFSLPPENLLTLLVPNFFGSLTAHEYWGRWFLWEMSLFVGAAGVVLTGYGLARGPRFRVWSCAAVAGVLLVIAFGPSTPLFGLLYDHAPGFSRFRGWSKFSYPAILLLIVVPATGFDVLLRGAARTSRIGFLALVLGAGCVAFTLVASPSPDHPTRASLAPWHDVISRLAITREQLIPATHVDNPAYVASVAIYAVRQVRYAAVTLLALAAVLLAARRYPGALAGVLALASIEMVCFARSCLTHFPIQSVFDPPDAQFLSAHAGESFRVYDDNNHDLAMSLHGYDLWGYDPGVLQRYAEWVAASQELDPDDASETLEIKLTPPVLATLLRARCRIATDWSPAGGEYTITRDGVTVPPAPRLMLVSHARVIADRNTALDAIFNPAFDPAHEVVLETAPVPAPGDAAPPGTARLVQETTDALVIEADLPAPAVLLVTDTFSDGWKARSLLPAGGAGAQTRYQVLPADYCLRGIPLGAGHHKILLEYRPTAYVVGKWVSLASLCLYLAGAFAWWAGRRRRLQSSPR